MRKYGETRIQGRGTNKQHIHLYYLGKVAKEKICSLMMDVLLFRWAIISVRLTDCKDRNELHCEQKEAKWKLSDNWHNWWWRCSVSQSCLTLWPHGLKHTRLHCPLPSPRACSNSCPLCWWCHQPSRPLSSSSPPAFSLSQHQGLFQWVGALHQVAKVLELQLQHQSFQWILRVDFL